MKPSFPNYIVVCVAYTWFTVLQYMHRGANSSCIFVFVHLTCLWTLRKMKKDEGRVNNNLGGHATIIAEKEAKALDVF